MDETVGSDGLVSRIWTGVDARGYQASGGVYLVRMWVDGSDAGGRKIALVR